MKRGFLFGSAALLLVTNLVLSNHAASANQPNAGLDLSIHVGGGDSTGNIKGTGNLTVGSEAVVTVSLDAIPGPWDAVAVTANYSGVLAGPFEAATKAGADMIWPGCRFEAAAPPAAGSVAAGCGKGATAPSVTFTGTVMTFEVTCTAAGAGTVSLVHGPADTLLIDGGGKTSTEAGPDVVNVNCVPGPNTFTPTPSTTPTPTNTATPTITPTPTAAPVGGFASDGQSGGGTAAWPLVAVAAAALIGFVAVGYRSRRRT